jgi:hypothetical protein
LNIVKQIMMRLGGDVAFAETPGGGATFSIDLPCTTAVQHVGSMPDVACASGASPPGPSPIQELEPA